MLILALLSTVACTLPIFAAPTATDKRATRVVPRDVGTPSATDSAGIQQWLSLHNDFRAHYGANALTWNSTLAAYAQKDSNTCKYGHTGGPYGENIAWIGPPSSQTNHFHQWSDESSLYDYNHPGYNASSGHFTQIVWKATRQLGCAVSVCPKGTIWDKGSTSYAVCEYSPPGNVVGGPNGDNAYYFKLNVGRPVN